MTRTRSPLLVWALAALAAVIALTVLMNVGPSSARTGTSTVSVPAGAATEALPLAASAPVGIEIPAIGVTRDSVMKLGYNEDLSLQVPTDAATVGWFSRGAAPGTNGPAVFASHVNYKGVEGGFAHLDALTAGDEILVHRADGSAVVFVVDRVEQASKQAFPTAQVYGPTGDAQIRLITCGGDFDASRRSYEDNVIVFGHAERAWR
ncbi:class F sortase [Actinomycetospora soli]|uniref:class F sortase n=1 Tax=Actinomycetospora soli TaxID=2893887 RepID=UPI001E645D83|nr:class F sortase [Actinomycetospora soli]MCD2188715.1 class F sortase [Actinomycetospora soli]